MLRKTAISLMLLLSSLTAFNANAGLIISNVNISSNSLSFDLSGTVDFVYSTDLDSFFFGFLDNRLWHQGVSYTNGFAKNSGTYDFESVGGVSGSPSFGTYTYTNGLDKIILGDVVDISYSIQGVFDLNLFDANQFVVVAGYRGNGFVLEQGSPVSGGTETTKSVSEPATVAVLGLGLLGLAARRRIKK